MTQSHCSSDPLPINYSRWHRGTMERLSTSGIPSISKDSSKETVDRWTTRSQPRNQTKKASVLIAQTQTQTLGLYQTLTIDDALVESRDACRTNEDVTLQAYKSFFKPLRSKAKRTVDTTPKWN